MAKVYFHYRDLKGHSLDEIRMVLIDHLTPPENKKLSLVGICDLPKLTDSIGNISKDHGRFYFPYTHAKYLGKDLGWFSGEESDALQSRYWVPSPMGGTFHHEINVYGKIFGDREGYPLSISIKSDDDGLGKAEELVLLEGWRKKLVEVGGDKKIFAEAVMDIYRNAQGASPEHEIMMQRFPNTVEGFDKKIKEVREGLWAEMFAGSVNLLRFGYDFFGKPLESMDIHPDNLRLTGQGNYDVMLEGKFGDQKTKEGRQLYAHPESSVGEMAKLLIPELPAV
jgi:hypothetical protein